MNPAAAAALAKPTKPEWWEKMEPMSSIAKERVKECYIPVTARRRLTLRGEILTKLATLLEVAMPARNATLHRSAYGSTI